MELAKEWITVPLCSLVPSPHNVRRHTTNHIEELAALIDAQGLLQNLVVTEAGTGRRKFRTPQFAVAAGERRRRAMLLLHKRGRLTADHESGASWCRRSGDSKSTSRRTAVAKPCTLPTNSKPFTP